MAKPGEILGTWYRRAAGAVVSTCSTPNANKIVSQSADTPQFCSRNGREPYSSPATTRPTGYTPPISITARSVIES